MTYTVRLPTAFEVTAEIDVVPGFAAVTRPVGETVAVPSDDVCHCTPEVTGAPALLVTDSCVVSPMPVRIVLPDRMRFPFTGEVAGVDAIGDEQAPACTVTASRPMASGHAIAILRGGVLGIRTRDRCAWGPSIQAQFEL